MAILAIHLAFRTSPFFRFILDPVNTAFGAAGRL
jgi:hypothetical protein